MQGLGEHVRHHLLRFTELETNQAGLDLFADPVMVDLHMLCPPMEDGVVGQVHRAEIVAVED